MALSRHLKPCLSPLLVLLYPPLTRITKSYFRILRVLLERRLPSLPKPQNARLSSLPLLTARAIQPVSPFVVRRSSLPLVLRSRVKSLSRQQISTLDRLFPLIPTSAPTLSRIRNLSTCRAVQQ